MKLSRVAALIGVTYVAFLFSAVMIVEPASSPSPKTGAETMYIRNLSPKYISDATIKRDIPAWEQAVNRDFAGAWHTTQFKLVFLGSKPAPRGQMVATFVDKGPVQGALAYHTTQNGAPAIVVYAGTAVYYGFDNSVSFTHELFELAADPTISITNQGWPYDWLWTVNKAGQVSRVAQSEGTVWAQEVCDPVEAYSYLINGVKISDFITPNWFNDEVSGGYDFMGLVQQPFTILWGGYAQFYAGTWNVVTNWRHGPRDANGFLKGEKLERK